MPENAEERNDLNEEDFVIIENNDDPEHPEEEPQAGAIQPAEEENDDLNEEDFVIVEPQVGAIQPAAGNNAGADHAAQDQHQDQQGGDADAPYNPVLHQPAEGAEHQNEQNIILDDVDDVALQTWGDVSAQNHDPQEAAPDLAFDRPDEEPVTEPMPAAVLGNGTNLDKLVRLKARVNERRNSDIYKAVCVARLLNHNQDNPLAGLTYVSVPNKTRYWGEKAWDSVVDVSNMVSGADTIYGNFLNENKNAKNGISVITNSITFINSTVNACRKIKHIVQNIKKNHKVLTLDNALEMFGLVGDACMMAAKAGNIIKSAYSLAGSKMPPWVKGWSKASYFLAGSSQFLSLGITSTNLFRKGLKIREFEKSAELFDARQKAIGVINDKKRPDEPQLRAGHVSEGGSSDLACQARAKELLKRNAQIRRMMENAPLYQNAQAQGQHGENGAAPAAAAPHEENGGAPAAAVPHEENGGAPAAAAPHEENGGAPAAAAPHEENEGAPAGAAPHGENAGVPAAPAAPAAPAGAGAVQADVQLSDDNIRTLVTYVALRGRVEDAELSLLKSVPGMIASTTGMLSSFWGGTNAQLNEAGTNKSMNTATKIFSTVSSAAVLGNSGYRLVQRGLDIKKDLKNPTPDGETNNLTTNFIWNRFEQIITNDDYGLKGLDLDIRAQGGAIGDPNHPNEAENQNYTALENRALDAINRYEQLNTTIGKLFIPMDKLIAAGDLEAFKKLLVVSGL